ncbi:hypothetical protein FA09DRAFT_328715 [Tilletiopsis washingtonensis]|uniref:HIT domain-containing protein n=1 Tax=Tilletiopsis washingtonensis TaxID=58919 RepID=A0A316ZE21_9BASI|nr:hypothetical protein FA09DRAFT_328715 [Tilletiopsis washingtonensis]PWN99298.1 hypothetical protein FA09DRAFT_328715 [Tilletiopsis washingtonensis]
MRLLAELFGCTAAAPADAAACIFCPDSVLSPAAGNRFEVVHSDARFLAFHDRSPAARVHLLAVPREHVDDVKVLRGAEGAELVRALQRFADEALDVLEAQQSSFSDGGAGKGVPGERRFGFHIPPFRSVPHLHMHAQVLPFVSSMRALKYRAAGDPVGARKGLSWYVTATQAARILEGGGRVRVRPCAARREENMA